MAGEPQPGLAARFLVTLARVYQASLSPYLGGQCRFVPTCSQYLIEAVLAYGAWRGACKGLWRILRCNPLGKGRYDPP